MKKGTTQLSKFKLLAKRLQMPDWQVVGLLESVWMFAIAETPAGDVGSKPDDAIAIQLNIEASEWRRVRDAMIAERWLDPDSRCRFVVHDFESHAPEWTKKLLKRAGTWFVSPDGGGEFAPLVPARRKTPDNGGQIEPLSNHGQTKANHDSPTHSIPVQSIPAHPVPVLSQPPSAVGGSNTTKDSDVMPRTGQHKPSPFNGEISIADRDALIALWNATAGRPASALDCRGLLGALDRIAVSGDVEPLARSHPLRWLTERARSYVASREATRDGGKWKCTLGNFITRDKWLEPDEAWAHQQSDGAPPKEDPETREKRIQELMAESEKARNVR